MASVDRAELNSVPSSEEDEELGFNLNRRSSWKVETTAPANENMAKKNVQWKLKDEDIEEVARGKDEKVVKLAAQKREIEVLLNKEMAEKSDEKERKNATLNRDNSGKGPKDPRAAEDLGSSSGDSGPVVQFVTVRKHIIMGQFR